MGYSRTGMFCLLPKTVGLEHTSPYSRKQQVHKKTPTQPFRGVSPAPARLGTGETAWRGGVRRFPLSKRENRPETWMPIAQRTGSGLWGTPPAPTEGPRGDGSRRDPTSGLGAHPCFLSRPQPHGGVTCLLCGGRAHQVPLFTQNTACGEGATNPPAF